MYERTLIDDKNSVPKDYTILYKYYGAHFKPVAYIEIDVNVSRKGILLRIVLRSTIIITDEQ